MSLNCHTVKDVTKAIAENSIEFVDLKFTDLYGQWQHFSVPVDLYDEDDLFKNRLGFDGSSIPRLQVDREQRHVAGATRPRPLSTRSARTRP